MAQAIILVVDDDSSISEFLRNLLEGEGWKVRLTPSGDEAIKSVHESLPDLVILDITMPGMDGFEVCRHINAIFSIPVIMLSARGDEDDKVKCLDMGAEDFITKPFQSKELIARVKGILRRHNREKPIQTQSPFLTGDLEINFETSRIRLKGKEIKLTPTELYLLEEFVLNAGKTITYERLLVNVWGTEYSLEKEYVHVHICHLRSKIEPDPDNPVYVVTIPGIGYRFEPAHNGGNDA